MPVRSVSTSVPHDALLLLDTPVVSTKMRANLAQALKNTVPTRTTG
jgi:hypothetical protein